MKLKNILAASIFLCVSMSIVGAVGETIDGDTVFIDTEDCYISVTPHTLTQSGYIDVCVRTKTYSGFIDIEYGFDKLSGVPITFEHAPKEIVKGQIPTSENIDIFNKAEHKLFNGKRFWYCDKNKRIDANIDRHVRVWIDIDKGTSGKYDVVIQSHEFVCVLDPYWEHIPGITSGLTYYADYNRPSAFYMDNKWNLVAGFSDGSFRGWDWVVDTWVINTSLSSGLVDHGTYSAVEVFNHNGVDYLIASDGGTGGWYGYNWSGAAWQADTNIVSGLSSIGTCNVATVFNMSGVLYLIGGAHLGDFTGWSWSGTVWESAPHITVGLDNIGTYSAPETYLKDNRWYLISGTADLEEWVGWIWKNGEWAIDNTVVSNIGDVGSNGHATIFSPDDVIYHLIYGAASGEWWGYEAYQQSYPANLQNTTGYAWVNWTWESSDNGNHSIDAYNVSVDGVWCNTTNSYHRHINMLPARETNISVWGFNTTNGVGVTYVSDTAWSGLFNATNKTGINGLVYDGILGSVKTIPNAIISVFNATWTSDPVISNSDGYFYIYGLENTTYSLTCSKDRFNTLYSISFAPTENVMYNKDLYMQPAISEYYKRHYVTFTLKNLFQVRYPGINVTVYENSIFEAAGTTGFDGSVVFHLLEDTMYTLTFINVSQGVSEEISLFPRDNEYTIYVGDFSFEPDRDVLHDNVQWWYLKNEINLTHSWLNFSYKNDDNKTSYIEYWINDTNDTILLHSSEPYPCSAGTCEINHVVNASNHTYIVHFSATHPDYPSLANSNIQTISFFTEKLINLFFSEQWHYTVVSICILMFLGLLFGATNAAKGGLIIVLTAWFFSWIQWLPSSLIGYSALVLATVLSVGWSLRKSEVVHT